MSRPRVLLAIETAGSACSAAVARDGVIVAAERVPLRHGHAEMLLPMVDRVMRAAGLAACDLDAVAAAAGPGGFTGIRVGLAAAGGIALAAAARAIGISSFAAVAASVARTGGADALLVALDSRREDLYVQLFAAMPLAPPQAVLRERLADYVAGITGGRALRIAGDAAAAAAAALAPHHACTVIAGSAPDARGVAAAALAGPCRGGPERALRPLYLRPPDVSAPRRAAGSA